MTDVLALKDEISKKLDLSAAASRDAAAGLPKEDATSLSATENNIVTAAEQKGWDAVRSITQHCAVTDEAIAECRKVVNDANKVIIKQQSIEPPHSGNIDIAKRRLKNSETAYIRFKTANNLTRDASGDDRLAQFLWALMIAAIESVMNAFFFREVATAGFVGGFFIAFIISIINIGFAFLGGALGLRYGINHCSPNIKILGLMWFMLCFSISMLAVAMSAWFRGHLDSVDLDTAENLQVALQSTWQLSVESLLSADVRDLFASLNSFSLALIGLLCAIGGAWKGYEFDDPYPGFGVMWRSMEEARDTMEEEHDKYTTATSAWRDAYISPLESVANKIAHALSVMKTEIECLRQANIHDIAEDTSRLAQVLLSEYRSINAVGRDTPSYFQEYPKRDFFSALHDEYMRVSKQSLTLQADGEQLINECRTLQRKIDNAISEH